MELTLYPAPPQGGYFSVAPNANGMVTVGIENKSRTAWLYVRRDLPLTEETYHTAEQLYYALCDRGWKLCWCGTCWF